MLSFTVKKHVLGRAYDGTGTGYGGTFLGPPTCSDLQPQSDIREPKTEHCPGWGLQMAVLGVWALSYS